MSNNDLTAIETALGICLPGRYRELMQAYPLDSTDHNDRIELQDDAKAVIAFNRFLRESFGDDNWHAHFFAFGNSPCGDPYFLDLSEGGIVVYCWNHETHDASVEATDFNQWIAQRNSEDVPDE